MDKKITATKDRFGGKRSRVFSSNDNKILETIKVGKSFGKMSALADVSFEVTMGEVLGIAGPNGAGKTTLFNVIAGKLDNSGDIVFNGKNISKFGPHQICKEGIARTFQIPLLFSTLSIFEHAKIGTKFGLSIPAGKDTDDEIMELLDFIGLSSKKHEIADNLDLFDKKLTMLAAAVSTKPKLLLLDEPVGGLSPREINDYISLIEKLKENLGLTIIVIEHLMPILTRIADRLMILESGRQICIGTPNEVRNDPYVREVYLGENAYA
ncbi:MAG: ABC transporter ATP-binding protein [Desulfobacterales bacterium]|nr:ABC transporter ATP-binding protein [Desulfobacterales bacterium]